MSDQQQQQQIALLTSINENVGGIRERMSSIESKVDSHGVALNKIEHSMEKENLPSRVSMIERDLGRVGRAIWLFGTVVVGLIVHKAWELITKGKSE